jgi:MAF protein
MILHWLKLPFVIQPARINETPHAGEAPKALTARLAEQKAGAIADRHPQAWILSADTVVARDATLLGKPSSPKDAADTLKALRDKQHHVYTAVTLYRPSNQQTYTRRVETRVHMRAYTDEEIATYVASGDPLDKAGAYAIQNADFHPVRRLDRCYANVVGLPLCALLNLLKTSPWFPRVDPPTICHQQFGYACPAVDPGRRL